MEQRVFASTKPFWDVAKEMFKKEKVQKQKSPSLTKEEVVVARQLYEEWNARCADRNLCLRPEGEKRRALADQLPLVLQVLNKRSSALGGRRLEGFGSRGEALTRCTSITMFYVLVDFNVAKGKIP